MLLIKFRWPDAGRVRAIAGPRDIELFEAIDSDDGYGFVNAPAGSPVPAALRDAFTEALPGARTVALQTIAELPGASAGTHAPYRYVVETDVQSEHETDFNRWYDEEHLAGLAGVPGTVRAHRLRDPAGSPRYYAWYDLATRETLGSPLWLAVRTTPWASRVRPSFRNTRRTMFRCNGTMAPMYSHCRVDVTRLR